MIKRILRRIDIGHYNSRDFFGEVMLPILSFFSFCAFVIFVAIAFIAFEVNWHVFRAIIFSAFCTISPLIYYYIKGSDENS